MLVIGDNVVRRVPCPLSTARKDAFSLVPVSAGPFLLETSEAVAQDGSGEVCVCVRPCVRLSRSLARARARAHTHTHTHTHTLAHLLQQLALNALALFFSLPLAGADEPGE